MDSQPHADIAALLKHADVTVRVSPCTELVRTDAANIQSAARRITKLN
jgi:hypothetical protein